MGKEYSENLHSIKNTGNNLAMKQMFDVSVKLIVGQSDDIYGVNTIYWVDSEVISLSHAKVYVFSDYVLCFGKMNENPQSNMAWEDQLT